MTKTKAWMLFVLALAAAACGTHPPRTLRVDCRHGGGRSHEVFELDQAVLEPLEWPGNPDQPVDGTNLGKYRFEVRDLATGRLLYSRGYASIYGEWETTPEADSTSRTFGESLRFPQPREPVRVVVQKRDPQNFFRPVWAFNLDPAIVRADNPGPQDAPPLIEIERHGDPAHKVDLLILGDGYTARESGKCEQDARRLTAALFATEPFASRRTDFNVRALCPASSESGISRPSAGIVRHSALGTSYDAFGTERYILSFDNRSLRRLASRAPYEFIEIMANDRTYGGGGIFNLYSTVAADSPWAPYVFVHELGHHLAGLADEYYTSDVAYSPPSETVEPWEPNVTALLDPLHLKWRALLSPGVPVPTPWGKEAFESYVRQIQGRRRLIRSGRREESEMDGLFGEEKSHEDKMLAGEAYAGHVGAFEGANYRARGYYRPEVNCIMFTRAGYYCRVCRAAIERVLDLYTKGPASPSP